ncbi:hypothetical protein [Pseudonocardia asaccharolytica]|uniref:Uncharacterized protein n=1 Tax=Pseudonocardia asaccharolytica DSM 44247 = NBRC 16224 TaxID=1123024 RepID=A0A511D583_9PSEU|nr:hypothetical protein [Pseudonocardia asaccharolytica]GEL19956.1 hypothetical protein PA7_37930 [Pseudonocardia asaccharolytica DSM 44247 = NBRC 16224]
MPVLGENVPEPAGAGLLARAHAALIDARLGDLPAGVRAVLELLAVGEPIGVPLLVRLTGHERMRVAHARVMNLFDLLGRIDDAFAGLAATERSPARQDWACAPGSRPRTTGWPRRSGMRAARFGRSPGHTPRPTPPGRWPGCSPCGAAPTSSPSWWFAAPRRPRGRRRPPSWS